MRYHFPFQRQDTGVLEKFDLCFEQNNFKWNIIAKVTFRNSTT